MTAASASASPDIHRPAHAPMVLIVEDDEDLAALLEYRLRNEGFTPLVASDGEEACRRLDTTPAIDLVLLDIMLPILDGWEVCRFIRRHADPGIASLPVIMLSALSAGDNRINGMECGADIYLAKPYSVQEVILGCRKLIDARLERSRLRSEIDALREQEENSVATRRMLFHELRSQFTVIGGLCRRLLKNDPGQLGEDKGHNYLRIIDHSVSQVSELADEMLLLARLDQAEPGLPLEACRLDQIVADVLAVHRQTALRKEIGIQLAPVPSEPFPLHRLALKVILSSLVENAIKYSPPRTLVKVSVTTDDTQLRLMVQDQGPGIPLHEREKIFAPYFRGEATRESHWGTGLGLHSVKRLTEALGGEIRLTSAPEQGSTFSITFHRSSADSAQGQQ